MLCVCVCAVFFYGKLLPAIGILRCFFLSFPFYGRANASCTFGYLWASFNFYRPTNFYGTHLPDGRTWYDVADGSQVVVFLVVAKTKTKPQVSYPKA